MKTLSKEKFSEISRWIYENARELDVAYFEYHFKNGSSEKVRNELQKFQNVDGGFGNGLESDIRTTLSSSIATTVALQYISELSLDENDKMIQIALSFFEKSFIEKEERWRAVPDETNLSPHASWWHIDEKSGMSAIDTYGWGNPTVEILGYLHKYENNFPKKELDALTKKALKCIFSDESKGSEHTLLCYQRFYSCAPKDLREKLFPQLSLRIQEIVNTNENEWREKYVPKPLDFVKTPTSPFYDLLPDLTEKNLDFLIARTEEGDAWFPTWTWGGKYEDAWESAKREWAGKISVENLILLKNFGRIE